jgi:hypothetical protein
MSGSASFQFVRESRTERWLRDKQGSAGARYNAVAEEGLPVRQIAKAI